jgi:hypothetical protein
MKPRNSAAGPAAASKTEGSAQLGRLVQGFRATAIIRSARWQCSPECAAMKYWRCDDLDKPERFCNILEVFDALR